ncbi:hypothetical protein Syun_023550 [Stephania yunnanensis]|uniref:Uncharacterized protein n=1 Tax=Stephania yunnanensis TaxID=152371 RepID=A0AAP0F9V0_9MAGN
MDIAGTIPYDDRAQTSEGGEDRVEYVDGREKQEMYTNQVEGQIIRVEDNPNKSFPGGPSKHIMLLSFKHHIVHAIWKGEKGCTAVRGRGARWRWTRQWFARWKATTMAMDSAAAVRRGVRRMKGGDAAALRWALRDGPTESARKERGDGGSERRDGGSERVERRE